MITTREGFAEALARLQRRDSESLPAAELSVRRKGLLTADGYLVRRVLATVIACG
jgi:hypothetical protein